EISFEAPAVFFTQRKINVVAQVGLERFLRQLEFVRCFATDGRDLIYPEVAGGGEVREHFWTENLRPGGPYSHDRRQTRELAPFPNHIVDMKNLCAGEPQRCCLANRAPLWADGTHFLDRDRNPQRRVPDKQSSVGSLQHGAQIGLGFKKLRIDLP